MAQLRLWALAEGGDICDRCEEIIWPEFELVRCDFCWGEFGPPDMEKVREAEKRHWKRIRAYEREMEESYREEQEPS